LVAGRSFVGHKNNTYVSTFPEHQYATLDSMLIDRKR